MSEEFRGWLKTQLKLASLSQRGLGRKIQMSQAYVNEIFTGAKDPSAEFCRRTAEALGIEADFFFRKAGILPPASEQEQSIAGEELAIIFRQLSPANQNDVLAYARWRLSQQKKL